MRIKLAQSTSNMKQTLLLLPFVLLILSCSSAHKSAIPAHVAHNVITRYSTDTVVVYGREVPSDPLVRSIDSLCYASLMDSTQLGIMIYDLTDNTIIYQYHENWRMRPASCMKLVTVITALDMLGADYTFTPVVSRAGWGWCWDDDETKQIPYTERNSVTLEDIIIPILKESDNLKAESVFAQLAVASGGKGTERKVSASCVNVLIQALGLNPSDYTIADGSGLSLYNYVSPKLLVELLKYAWNNPRIRPYLYASLPVAGVDGTLENRFADTPAYDNLRAKTGTVTAVSSLSGYCRSNTTGHDICFSIINQGVRKTSYGRSFQDKVCVLLCR